MPVYLCQEREVSKNHDAKNNPVNTERGEGMAAHILHEPPTDQQAHQEGHHTANHKNADFRAGGADAGNNVRRETICPHFP